MSKRTDKPLAIRNGLKVYKRLQAKKPMNQVSRKQVKKNNVLNQSRKVLKAQAGELCMVCHKLPTFGGLQVHHKVFRSRGGNNNPDNLILVCLDCHRSLHGVK